MSKFLRFACIAIALLMSPKVSSAGEQSVTLTVEKMVCPVCAYRVKKTLESVAGVKQATVSVGTKTAVVLYDETQVGASELAAAIGKAGFPAAVKR